MKEPKTFIIPPDLQNKLLIFGLTIPEFVTVVLLVFIAVNRMMAGQKGFIVLPFTAFVLFFHVFESNTNLLSILIRRFKFYIISQVFSLKGGLNSEKKQSECIHKGILHIQNK